MEEQKSFTQPKSKKAYYNREGEFYIKNSVASSIFEGHEFVEKMQQFYPINNDEDTKLTLRVIFKKEILIFTQAVNEENLYEILMFMRKKIGDNLNEMTLKLTKKEKTTSSISGPVIKIDFDTLQKFDSNPKETPKSKEILHKHKEMIENPQDFTYELKVAFKKAVSELKLIYQKGINPLEKHKDLKSNVTEFFVKRTTNLKQKFCDKSSAEQLKKFEEDLRNSLIISKNANRNISNVINVKTPNESCINVDEETPFFTDFRKLLKKDENSLDLFENIVIKIISEKFTFSEWGNYIYLYLYDNFKKLKDPKTIENLKNKIRENKEIRLNVLEKIQADMNLYYETRKKYLNYIFHTRKSLKNNTPLDKTLSNSVESSFVAGNTTEVSMRSTKSGMDSTMDITLNETLNKTLNKAVKKTLKETQNETQNETLNKTQNKTVNETLNETLNSTFIDFNESTFIDINESTKEKNLEFIYLLFITVKLKGSSELDLSLNQILNDNILNCVSALKLNDTITKVSFNMNKLGDEGCWGLGRVFNYNSTITDVDMSLNNLTDDNLDSFLIGLDKGRTSITRLNLSNNYTMTKNCGPYIAEIIEKSPNLKHLNITKDPIESGFNHITNVLLKLTSEGKCQLTDLFAMQIKLDSNSLKLLSKLLAHPKCTLKHLVLNENKMNNEGGRQLIRAIGKNKSLEQLVLYKCEIGNSHVDDLIYMLKKNTKLNIVYLYENKITDPEKFTQLVSFAQTSFINNDLSAFTKYEPAHDGTVSDKTISLNFTDVNSSGNKTQFDIFHMNKTNDYFLNQVVIRENYNNTLINNSTNNLKHLDISKNKCRLVINQPFLDVIENVDIDMLDICQNIEDNAEKLDLLKRVVVDKTDNSKILY